MRLRRRDADVRERHDRMVVGDVVRVRRACAPPRRRRRQVEDEQHVLAVGQHGLHEAVVGQVVRRHVPLHPVDDVTVAVAHRGGGDRVDIRAGELLGDRVALVPFAAHRRQQPALALVIGGDVDPPGRRRVHHPGEPVGDPPDLLLHEHLLQHRASGTADRRAACSSRTGRARALPCDVRRRSRRAALRRRVRPSTSNGVSSSANSRAASRMRRSSSLRPYIVLQLPTID